VGRAGAIVKQRWPDAKLHILAWDIHSWYAGTFDRFLQGLAQTGWKIHDVNDVLPGYTMNHDRYEIHPFDAHPNAHAHEVLARYIVDSILLRGD
jgi:hypothetical protein